MLFLSAQDFFQKADAAPKLTRAEKAALGVRAKEGDATAKEELFRAYLPFVASLVRRHFSEDNASLNVIFRMTGALEELLAREDISQNDNALISSLSLRMRQEMTRYIGDGGGR